MPAFERTEVEKIRLAQAYLEKRGFIVLPQLIGINDVIEYLGCSARHLKNLREHADFPTPFDIGATKKSIDHTRQKPRWLVTDVVVWLKSRRT